MSPRVPALALLLGLILAPFAFADGPERPAPPEWTKEQGMALVALAGEYLRIVDDPARTSEVAAAKDAILSRAAEIGALPPKAVKKVVKDLFEVAREGPRCEGKSECTADFQPFPGRYFLSGAGSGKGVFIGLHGGGPGVGDGRTAQSQWGSATGKGLIGVFPTANLPDRATTWQSPEVEAFVIAILRELKRAYRIDTNRVYVAGHSLGGSGAWQIGLKFADLFAGVSPNAGGLHGVPAGEGKNMIPGGFVGNLFATPIFFTHFDQDPRVDVKDARAAAEELGKLRAEHPDGYEHVYIEGKGVDHGFPPGGDPSKIVSWLTKHERSPCPETVVWEPNFPVKHLFFWLRKRVAFETSSPNTRLVATRAGNRIEVKGLLADGLSVMLTEEMIDPAKPVTVLLNGKPRYEGFPPIDPRALLESILENLDPEQIFFYRIDL